MHKIISKRDYQGIFPEMINYIRIKMRRRKRKEEEGKAGWGGKSSKDLQCFQEMLEFLYITFKLIWKLGPKW